MPSKFRPTLTHCFILRPLDADDVVSFQLCRKTQLVVGTLYEPRVWCGLHGLHWATAAVTTKTPHQLSSSGTGKNGHLLQ